MIAPLLLAAWAASPADTGFSGARLFETVELSAEAGLWTPLGDLADLVDPAPLVGLRLTSSYFGPCMAFGSIAAARLDAAPRIESLVLATGSAGLEWRPPRAFLPALGLALSLHYVRPLGEEGGEETYLFLEDGESEFGMQGSMRWGVPLNRKMRLVAGGHWDLQLTSPRYSHAVTALLGAAWAW